MKEFEINNQEKISYTVYSKILISSAKKLSSNNAVLDFMSQNQVTIENTKQLSSEAKSIFKHGANLTKMRWI